MTLIELSEKTTTTYRVIDLVKDKFNKSFTGYSSAIRHCEWCLENGATELRLITTECNDIVEEVSAEKQ